MHTRSWLQLLASQGGIASSVAVGQVTVRADQAWLLA